MDRGKLWIIPNEEEILQEIFERDIHRFNSYLIHLQEFSNMYKLGFDFDIGEYQIAFYKIAMLGNLIIKADDDLSMVTCYIPEQITDRQYNWLYQNVMMLNTYIKVDGHSLQIVDENGICLRKIHGMEEIMKEVRKKNLSNIKGKVMVKC